MAPLRCKASLKSGGYCWQMKHLCFYSAVPTPALPVCCIIQENLLQESPWEAGSLQDALQVCSRSGRVAEAAVVLPNSYSTSTLQRQCVHYSAWSASVTWSTELQLLPKWTKFSHGTQIFLGIRELWPKHSGDSAGTEAMLHWPTLTTPLSSVKLFGSAGCHQPLPPEGRGCCSWKKNPLLLSAPPKLKSREVKWMSNHWELNECKRNKFTDKFIWCVAKVLPSN